MKPFYRVNGNSPSLNCVPEIYDENNNVRASQKMTFDERTQKIK